MTDLVCCTYCSICKCVLVIVLIVNFDVPCAVVYFL